MTGRHARVLVTGGGSGNGFAIARGFMSAKINPMGRLIAAEEVAGAALRLASDAAAGVNGQAIAIDGGETA